MSNKNVDLIKTPVVVIMGHVDSGKTSILDYIRKTKVQEKEFGGITQHVGAYQVKYNNKKITFIDTPGHEAFSEMRRRGSKIADIAILVIDGVSGIQKQTKEAIKYIKEAGINMIVVVNKIDRKESNIERIKSELINSNILVEDMGGEIPLIKTSAITGKGIDDLLEIILLITEIQETKNNTKIAVKGVIIESHLNKQKGPVATALILSGVLREGDIIATDLAYGKIKRMETFNFIFQKQALPGDPIIIYGFQKPPQVGGEFFVFQSINSANNFIQKKTSELQKLKLDSKGKEFEIEEKQKVLNIIIKTDVIGTIDAIKSVLSGIPQEKVLLNLIEIEVGEVNENDIKKAVVGKAVIFAFNVKTTNLAKLFLEKEKIKVIEIDVIYRIVEKVKILMEKMLKPEKIKIEIGKLKVTVIFNINKDRQIIGGRVIDGEIKKKHTVEIMRNDEIIEEGKIISLQKNKKEIEIARKRDEVAIMYKGKKTIQEDDHLITFKIEKRKIEI